MKNMDDLHYESCVTGLTLFTISKDKWNTKEGTGKTTQRINVLYLTVIRYKYTNMNFQLE